MTRISDRFPAPLDNQWTPIPHALRRYAAALGLGHQDVAVIEVLERDHWRRGDLVQIGLRLLAREAGMSVRAVQRVTAKLDRMGLVPKSQPGGEDRGRGRTVYHMDPLWHRLADLDATGGVQIPDLDATGDDLDATGDDLDATSATRIDVPDIQIPHPPAVARGEASGAGARERGPEQQQQPVVGEGIENLGGNGEEGGGGAAPPASSDGRPGRRGGGVRRLDPMKAFAPQPSAIDISTEDEAT